jgi:hypothetical protein
VVPAVVTRLIPTVSCWLVGVDAPATTPRVTRRSLKPLFATACSHANPVSTASAALLLHWAEYRAIYFAPFWA